MGAAIGTGDTIMVSDSTIDYLVYSDNQRVWLTTGTGTVLCRPTRVVYDCTVRRVQNKLIEVGENNKLILLGVVRGAPGRPSILRQSGERLFVA